MTFKAPHRSAAATALLLAVGLLSACATPSGDAGDAETLTQAEIDAAMQEPTTLTYWSWLNKESLDKAAAAFQEEYPAITIKIENPAPSGQQGQFLRTALEAGTGIPDVVQFSGDLSSFVLTGDLLDLSPYGATDLEDKFLPSAWDSVAIGDGIYGIPQDTGPVGVLYRQDLLDAAGIETYPTTWEDFVGVAEKYRTATGQYLTNVSGVEMAILNSQVGPQGYQWDGGTNITLALNSPERQEAIAYLQDLIDRDLVSTDAEFVDSFYQGIANGKYASWLTGSWAPTLLQGVAASTAGSWSVATLPQWAGGEERYPTLGGSQVAVPVKSEHPIQAAVFTQWLNSSPTATSILTFDLALFPATNAQIDDPEWLNYEDPFFGGQKTNTFWADVAKKTTATLESPLGSYVNQASNDTVAVALSNGGDLAEANAELARLIAEYATAQGFTVTEG